MEATNIDLNKRGVDATLREIAEAVIQLMPSAVHKTEREPRIVTGVPALSKELNVSETTLHEWKAKGYLDGSFSQIDRTILFDLDKVLECIKHKPNRKPKRGRYSRR